LDRDRNVALVGFLVIVFLIVTFGGCIDLELGKVCENLAHCRACENKVFDQSALKHLGTNSKRARQALSDSTVLALSINAHNLKSAFNVGWLILKCEVTISVDKLSCWNQSLDLADNVLVLVVELITGLSNGESVAVSILVFQVIRRAKYYEATINHDGNLVTELFSLVHAMSGQ